MKVTTKNEKILGHKTEALILGLFEKQKLTGDIKKIDDTINNEISFMIKNKEFKGEFKEAKLINTHRKLPANKILLVGLGKEKDITSEKLRRLSAVTAKAIRNTGIKSFSTTLHSMNIKGLKINNKAQIVTEGIVLGLYEFKKYITVDKDKIKKIDSVVILEPEKKNTESVNAGLKKGVLLSENVTRIRDLINEPAELITPTYLANEARKIAKESNGAIKIKIFGKAEIEKMGMGGLSAVSKGSAQEPKFIILDYNSKKKDPLIFVGKGITFDSGGLNIKPAIYMEDMRCDMAGAATVLYTIKSASQLKLKKRVIAIVPTCENLLGSKAYKQGDILKAYNGKTIEVWHTDAEGRLILADGLSYADKNYKAKAIIDIATLTGASIFALGYEITSLMSTNEKLKNKILSASKKTDENAWELPLLDDYKELVKGESADVRNTSKESFGPGTITAGLFLGNFVEKTPWAHLDIGASGWAPSDKDYKKKGGTGICLRTFIQLIEDWK